MNGPEQAVLDATCDDYTYRNGSFNSHCCLLFIAVFISVFGMISIYNSEGKFLIEWIIGLSIMWGAVIPIAIYLWRRIDQISLRHVKSMSNETRKYLEKYQNITSIHGILKYEDNPAGLVDLAGVSLLSNPTICKPIERPPTPSLFSNTSRLQPASSSGDGLAEPSHNAHVSDLLKQLESSEWDQEAALELARKWILEAREQLEKIGGI